MHRSFALAAAAAVAVSLGACGSDTTEGDSDVPENADTPTTQATAPSDESPDTEPVPAPDSVPGTSVAAVSTDGPVDTAAKPADTSSDGDGDGVSTPDRLGSLAATDLAERLGVTVDEIDVVSVDEVTWPDASLGCPQKDFQYAQVLTPGIRIELSSQGRTYAYHGGDGRDPFYCVDPQQPV